LPRLFTFILEFGGGTYITQAEADDVSSASVKWLAALTSAELKEWGLSREALQESLDEGLVALDGVRYVWCGGGLAGKKSILLNVVATESN
jgi:hypothetical protein